LEIKILKNSSIKVIVEAKRDLITLKYKSKKPSFGREFL